MPSKRAAVPPEVFNKRPSALDKLTGAAPEQDATSPHDRSTVLPQNSDIVETHEAAPSRATKAAGEKTTFYLRPDQIEKLDDLVIAYKRHTGRRKGVNRNDIVRQLIDRADLSLLTHERDE